MPYCIGARPRAVGQKCSGPDFDLCLRKPTALEIVIVVAVSTNKFTVTAADGNNGVTGTLIVEGAVTAPGTSSSIDFLENLSVNTNKFVACNVSALVFQETA